MRRATEAECQQAIIEAAKTGGWLVHAERAAKSSKGWATPIQGDAGWPDLVLLHPRMYLCIFAELKRKPNKVEPAQAVWLTALRDQLAEVGLAETEVSVWWVPENLDAICQALADGRIPRIPRIEGSDEW